LLEDEGPEVWDLGDKRGALFVERRVERFGFADCVLLDAIVLDLGHRG
jgi:hypothetical protein